MVKGEDVGEMVDGGDCVKKGSFVFENSGVGKVVGEVWGYYGVKVVGEGREKGLRGNLDGESVEEMMEIIEKVLKVDIKKEV